MRAALLLLVALTGCSVLPAAKRAAGVYACKVAAIEPYVGQVFDAEELVRDILTGKVDPSAVFQALDIAESDYKNAAEAWRACR